MRDAPATSPPEWPARLGRGALFGILVVMPLLFWTSASEFFEWPKLMATRVGAVVILAAAVWHLTARGRVPTSSLQEERESNRGSRGRRNHSPTHDRSVPAPTVPLRDGIPSDSSLLQPPSNPQSASSVNSKPETRNPKHPSVDPNPLDLPVLLYLAVYALSSALSIDPGRSLGLRSHNYGGLASVLAAASACLAVRLWARDAGAVRRLLGWACDACILTGLYALAQRMGLDRLLFGWALPSQERVFSTFGHPNYYAAYLCLLIPVSLALTECAARGPARWMGLARTLFFLAMLTVTFSRGGWIGAAAAMTVYVLLRNRNGGGSATGGARTRGLLALLGALAIAGVALLAGWDEVRARLESTLRWKGSTLESRWLAWRTVPEIVADDPWLGTGPETFLSTFAKRRPEGLNVSAEWSTRPAQAHNELLHLFATTGVFGLGAFLGLLAVWMWRVVWPTGRVPTSSLPEEGESGRESSRDRRLNASGDRSAPAPTASPATAPARESAFSVDPKRETRNPKPNSVSVGDTVSPATTGSPAPAPSAILGAGLNAAVAGFLVQSLAGFSTAGTAPFFWAFLAMAQALRAPPLPPPSPAASGERGAPSLPPGGARIRMLSPLLRGATLAFVVFAGADLVKGIRTERALGRGLEATQLAQAAITEGRKDIQVEADGQAVTALGRALALDPTNDAAGRMLAESRLRLGLYREAREAADGARAADRFEGENLRMAARVRFVEALPLAAADPAVATERLRLLREVEDLYRAAWEREPSRVELVFQYAIVCAEAGDLRGAEVLCREVQRLKADYPDGYVLEADIRWRQGRVEEAGRLVAKALEIDPKHKEARALAERLDGH